MKTKFKLSKEEKKYYFDIANTIIYTEVFVKLKEYRHHGNISTYTHAVKVSYLSYCFALKNKWHVNLKELIRAALLHDLYFYDWHNKDNGIHFHGLFHPSLSVKNAKKYYGITNSEIRAIAHHMFPLTLIPPTTKNGIIICLCDKYATHSDYKALKISKKIKKRLLKSNF